MTRSSGVIAALGALLACAHYEWDPAPADAAQHETVVAALGLARGARVAALEAGRGDLAFRLADEVGPEGVVYAVVADAAAFGRLAERARAAGRANVVAVQGASDDPRLPDASVELVLVAGTYLRLANRTAYFERVKRALRPGGRVAIAERTQGDLLVPAAIAAQAIENELEAAGYALAARRELSDLRSVLSFTPSR